MGVVNIGDLVHSILECSEKAANVARSIRNDERLFRFLIQEKGKGEANKRFSHDFKTLADVLIQETLRYDLNRKFQGLGGRIFGEENGQFTNTSGQSVHLTIHGDQRETESILEEILNGDRDTASLLAELVYTDVSVEKDRALDVESSVELNDLGIWIDPIDGTAEYIRGQVGQKDPFSGVYTRGGVQCSTVLVGVIDIPKCLPVAGVVNLPFYDLSEGIWTGRSIWGICNGACRVNNMPPNANATDKIIIRGGEPKWIGNQFKARCVIAPTAGYKVLCVADGAGQAYISSTGNLYFWDSCAPEAVLRSMGGGVVVWRKAMDDGVEKLQLDPDEFLERNRIKYTPGDPTHKTHTDAYLLKKGIIAYRSVPELLSVMKELQEPYRTMCMRRSGSR